MHPPCTAEPFYIDNPLRQAPTWAREIANVGNPKLAIRALAFLLRLPPLGGEGWGGGKRRDWAWRCHARRDLFLNDHVDIAIQSMIPEAENAAVE